MPRRPEDEEIPSYVLEPTAILRRLAFRWKRARFVGIVFCPECHHVWRHHYARAYHSTTPYGEDDWDLDYGCERCDDLLKGCGFGLERDDI